MQIRANLFTNLLASERSKKSSQMAAIHPKPPPPPEGPTPAAIQTDLSP
jgi:hypothetical protein